MQHLVDGDIDALRSCARDEFHLSAGSLFAYVNPVGNSNEIGVFEFDAGTLVSVIQQHVDSGGVESGCDLLAGFAQRRVRDIRYRYDDGEGRDTRRQPEPLVVIRLLDGGGENALDADPVATH